MFGELALLLRRARRARVTAITHCTLLALDEASFLALARENEAVAALIVARAAKRGVTLDPGVFAARVSAPPLPLRWLRSLHAVD
jgi:CPA1 family monovalent cation:H+ antiporter